MKERDEGEEKATECNECAEARKERQILLRRLYDTERQLINRNFAKDHSFEEWLNQ